MARKLLLTAILVAALPAGLFGMDPDRGKQVLQENNCLSCHNVRGEGQLKAPDLSGRLVDHYTPAALASLLWNHLPEMWSAMSRELVGRPRPTERDAEDLFAYLYAAHFTTPQGRENRGQRAFEQRGCATCHTAGPGMPVENWEGITDAFELVQRMWNHAPLMRQSRQANGVMFERVSSRDLADIAEFVSRGSARTTPPATMPETRQGEALFKANCAGCHPAIVDLTKRMRDRTPFEVASSLWNHATSMQTVPLAAPNDMRSLVGYVWNLQFQTKGDAVKGAKLFENKKCVNCHLQMNRGERVFTEYTLISLWWAHGPLMQADMEAKKARWPYLSDDDIEDLVAFINTRQ